MLPNVAKFFPPLPPAYTDLYIPVFATVFSEKTNQNIYVDPIKLWADIMAQFVLSKETTFLIISFKFYSSFITHPSSFPSPHTQANY